jgi:hypothetical protein
MSNENKINRREFFIEIAKVTGTVAVASTIVSGALAEERRRGSSPAAGAKGNDKLSWPVVEPGKDAAVAMAYHHIHADGAKDKNTIKAEKSGFKWESQYCKNCAFYTEAGKKKIKIGGSEKEVNVGPCTIFPNKLVAADGICNSWSKKS